MIDLVIQVTIGIVVIYVSWKIIKHLLIQRHLNLMGQEYRNWYNDVLKRLDEVNEGWKFSSYGYNNSQEYGEYLSGTPAWYHW